VHLQRRTVRSEEGKLRQEERSFATEQNTFTVRRASRTPQACSKSHRPWRFVHLRARARPRVQCFLFFAFTPSPLLQLLRFQLVTDEKTVKAR